MPNHADHAIAGSATLRLLPWDGPEGRPALLLGDAGILSQLADEIEAAQLESARSVWGLAPVVLDDPASELGAVRFAARRLHEALGDVLRVIRSRQAQGTALSGAAGSPHVGRWPYDARLVGQVRHDLLRVLAAWDLDSVAESAELVLSELFTNALRHTDVPDDSLIETRYVRLPNGVRIEVHDADSARPTPLGPLSVDAETGRGLALVDALTGGQWGVSDRDGVGKRVWALCTLSSTAAR
ncbi:ATP-binding protein [Streptomyces sp. NBC_00433]